MVPAAKGENRLRRLHGIETLETDHPRLMVRRPGAARTRQRPVCAVRHMPRPYSTHTVLMFTNSFSP